MAPTTSAADALRPSAILALMSKSLSPRDADSSPITLKDPYATVALFCHACMLAVGFRLIGLGEDHRIGMLQDDAHVACD